MNGSHIFSNSKYRNGASWRTRAMELVDHQSHQGLLSWFASLFYFQLVVSCQTYPFVDKQQTNAQCLLLAQERLFVDLFSSSFFLMQKIFFIKPSAASAMSGRFSRTIYVGNLPLDIRESELDDLFYKYGRIVDIELKIPPRPPAYCFVEYERSRDAEDAIKGRDGYNFDGHYLRVELAHGGRGSSSALDRRSGYGSGGGGRHGVSHHSEYRVSVRNLPSSASWQDLKDHMRKAGDVCFAEVFRDGDGTFGLVDYTNYEDMKYAIRKLNDTEFKNPFSRSYIRVECYKGNTSRSHSRSRSRSPRKDQRSASKSVSSRSRSPSPARSSRSRSG